MSNSKRSRDTVVMPIDRLEEMLKKVVGDATEKTLQAGYTAAKLETKREFNSFRATEERLRALPAIRAKLEDDRDRLDEMEKYGEKRRSPDLIRYMRGGTRVNKDQIEAAVLQNLEAEIAADEWEIRMIEKALEMVRGDVYYLAIPRKYFEMVKDAQVAKELHCDETTVRRNRNRLVRQIAVRLYGSQANTNAGNQIWSPCQEGQKK